MRRAYPCRALAASTLAALAAIVAALSSGCATPIAVKNGVDPLAILEPGLAAYIRIEGEAARRLLPAFLAEEDAASLAPLLARTRVAAVGIGRAAPVPPETGAPSGGASSANAPARTFEAALAGDFPFRRASFALASSRAWKREGKAYVHAASGIRATVPASGLVLASTESTEPLVARAIESGTSPLPPRLAELAGLSEDLGPAGQAGAAGARPELLLWLPDPFASLAPASGPDGGLEIPSRGLFMAASPGEAGSYLATVAFLMSDADSARIFRPALRLGWYLVARSLLGDAAGTALGARFALDGELVIATGVPIPEEALIRAARLAIPDPGASAGSPPGAPAAR